MTASATDPKRLRRSSNGDPSSPRLSALGKCFSSRPAGDDMASETVVIPLSQEPLCEASGIFWGALAFPSDPNKRDRFAKAWCRESFRLSAVENADFARTPQLLKPGYFIM